MQRLLWEIGGNLAFGPPTVDQYRNAHNLLRDFKDELPLYELAGKLVKLLDEWRAPAGADLPSLMTGLAQAMADAKMWEQGDAELMAAWVADLKAVGYTFPERAVGHSVLAEPAPAFSGPDRTSAGKPPAVVPRTPLHWKRHGNIVVVVVFNLAYEGWENTYRLLKEAYTPIFGTVVFTGQVNRPEGMPKSERWVACECAVGALQYACYANAIQEYPAPADGGHLILGDDTIISHCQLERFNASKVRFISTVLLKCCIITQCISTCNACPDKPSVRQPVCAWQIWFPRAVQAVKEDVEECLERKIAKEEYTYVFSKDSRAAMNRVLTGFMTGPLHSKYGEQIRRKLGTDLQNVRIVVCSLLLSNMQKSAA